jgi:hypothetical protein
LEHEKISTKMQAVRKRENGASIVYLDGSLASLYVSMEPANSAMSADISGDIESLTVTSNCGGGEV